LHSQTVPYDAGEEPIERRILGFTRKTFFIILGVLIIVILAAVVGGVVGGIEGSKKKSTSSSSSSNSSTSNNNNNNNNNGYTPYSITTGNRQLNLTYSSLDGDCAAPGASDENVLAQCSATSGYTVQISGSVSSGYTISSVAVIDSAFSNIAGTPPNGTGPGDQTTWIFVVNFQEDVSSCTIDRTTKYSFGQSLDDYAIEEEFLVPQVCTGVNSSGAETEVPAGTFCACFASAAPS